MKRFFYILLCLILTACTSEEPTEENQSTTATVPITLSLGELTTRSAPPGSTDPMNPTIDGEDETAQTDRVRIVVFRCKDTQSDIDAQSADLADSDFVYDPTNDQTVTCSRATPTAHRLTAHGTLLKLKGYAYRVIALAYSTSRSLPFSNSLLSDMGEENLFTLNLSAGTTLADFQADLTHVAYDDWKDFRNGTDIVTRNTHSLSGQLCYAPQLFYGQCTSSTDSNVIRFRETDVDGNISTTLPLTGVLYRGMAKVQLTLNIDKLSQSGTLQWVGLLANETRTSVSLSSYDQFLSPFAPIHTSLSTASNKDTYTLISFTNTGLTVGSTVTLTAWVLPTATKLAIRTWTRSGALVRYPHTYPIEVGEYSSAETGTGIISPDVVGNTFYLRRNQRYAFSGNISTLMSKKELE